MISIITPVRNSNAFIETYIRSLLSQTDKRFELVIVNDGSTDDVEQMLSERLKELPDVRVITQAHSGILSATLNGIRNCKGDYVAFVDSDDIIVPEFIAELNRCTQTCQPDLMLYKNASYREYPCQINDDTNAVKDFSANKRDVIKTFFLTSKYRTLSEKCIRKELLENEDLSDLCGIKHAPDVALSIYPILHANTIIHLDKTLYFAPIRHVTTNKSYVDRRYQDYRRIYAYTLNVLKRDRSEKSLIYDAQAMFLDFTLFSLSCMFFGWFEDQAIRGEFFEVSKDPCFCGALTLGSAGRLPVYKSVLAFMITSGCWRAYRLIETKVIAPKQMKNLGLQKNE